MTDPITALVNFVRSLPHMLGSYVRIAWNGRSIYYWLSMLLLALAGLLIRNTFIPAEEATVELKRLLHAQEEPTRNTRLPALSAAIIGPHNDWTLCSKDPGDGTDGTGGALPDQVFELFQARYLGDDKDLSAWDERFRGIATLLGTDDSWARPIPPDPNRVLVKDTTAAKDESMDFARKEVRRRASHGSKRVEELEHSTLRLPSQLAGLVPVDGDPARLVRLQRAIEQSRSLEPLHVLQGKQAVLPQRGQDPQELPVFQQFYFISVDGLMRVTPKLAASLPAHRGFTEGNAYLESLLPTVEQECMSPRHPRRYHSRPYLDLNGRGFVITLCYPVVEETSRPSLAGAFCSDISLPRKHIHESLSESELFKTTLVELRKPVSGNNRPEVVFCGEHGFKCPASFSAPNKDAADQTRKTALDWWDRSQRSSYAGAADMKVIQNGSVVALIETGLTEANHPMYRLALIEPISRFVGSWWNLAGAGVCVLLITAIIAHSLILKDRLRDGTLLRGLQVGVVRLDENEFIIGANDRAEELLRRPLPKLGLPASAYRRPEGRVSFESLTQGARLYRKKTPDPGAEFEPFNPADIQRERRAGQQGEYWARLDIKGEQKWFRVVGSPIQLTNGRIETFGLFEPADEHTKNRLEALEENKEREEKEAAAAAARDQKPPQAQPPSGAAPTS